jgi:hypothetical protein
MIQAAERESLSAGEDIEEKQPYHTESHHFGPKLSVHVSHRLLEIEIGDLPGPENGDIVER